MDNKSLVCSYCKRVFKHSSSVYKHVSLKRCPVLKTGYIADKNQENVKLVELCSVIADQKDKIQTLTKQLHEAQKQIKSMGKMVMGNTTVNNGTINIDNSTTINQNILVVYGNEKIKESHALIDFQKLKPILLNNAQEFIPGAIKEIHNNDKIPEFQNLEYDSETDKISCYNGEKWVEQDTIKVTSQLALKVANPAMYQPIADLLDSPDQVMNFSRKTCEIAAYANSVEKDVEKQRKICNAIKQKNT